MSKFLNICIFLLIGFVLGFLVFTAVKKETLELGLRTFLPVQGGTGTSTSPGWDDILIGGDTANRYDVKTLTAGTNITIATSSGAVTISSTGGGASFGQAWSLITNTYSQSALAPTTTQNIHVSGTGTSTLVSNLEAWGAIGAPRFFATSTTASTTIAGPLEIQGPTGITTLTNAQTTDGLYLGLGIGNPVGRFHVSGDFFIETGDINHAGTQLSFYPDNTFSDFRVAVDGSAEGVFRIIHDAVDARFDLNPLTASRTYTLPDSAGTLCLTTTCVGTSFSNWEVSGSFLQPTTTITTLHNNGLVSQASSTVVGLLNFSNATGTQLTLTDIFISGDQINDFAGTGLTVTGNALTADLGTDIDLTAEVTGTLPVGNGGTGITTCTDGGIVLGSGTSPFTCMSVLSDGHIVVGDGTTDPTTIQLLTSSTGTVRHEVGGIEADISGWSGIIAIAGGAAVEVDTKAELETQISDVADFAEADGDTYSGTHDFNSATVKIRTYPAFSYATTSWSGTTTVQLGPAFTAEAWNTLKCFTDAGTVDVVINDGTNNMNLVKASTTVGTNALTTNNTFTASEKRFASLGNPATSPRKVSCTVDRTVNN